jgi:hypothetical protein
MQLPLTNSPHHHIGLRKVCRQLVGVALSEAAGHDDLALLAISVEGRGGEDGLRCSCGWWWCSAAGSALAGGHTRQAHAHAYTHTHTHTRTDAHSHAHTHLERLGLRILHEAARVDDDCVCVLVLLDDIKAAPVQVAEQHLACRCVGVW